MWGISKLVKAFGLIRRPAAEPAMESVNEVSCFIPDDNYVIETTELLRQGLISRQDADEMIGRHYYQKRLREAQEAIAEGEHNLQLQGVPNPVVRYADLPILMRYYPLDRASDRIKISQKVEDWLIRWRK